MLRICNRLHGKLERELNRSRGCTECQVRCHPGFAGSGHGKGGGSGGSIRSAGGAFGEMEAARENQYFRNVQRRQLDELKKKHQASVDYHGKQIMYHQEMISKHRESVERVNAHIDEVGRDDFQK